MTRTELIEEIIDAVRKYMAKPRKTDRVLYPKLKVK